MIINVLYDAILLLAICTLPSQSFPIFLIGKSHGLAKVAHELRLSEENTNGSVLRQKDPTSYISEVRSRNLAGVHADETSGDVVVDLKIGDSINSMVVVTGETGSGKSLLVSKVADLVTGGKVDTSLLQRPSDEERIDSTATTEMVLKLYGSHISSVMTTLQYLKVDPGPILGNVVDLGKGTPFHLSLKRSIISTWNGRTKSICEINGQTVKLKVLKAVASPLLAIVNAPSAGLALGKPNSRMSIIDIGIPPKITEKVRQLQREYNNNRKEREMLETELQNQVLPASMVSGADIDEDLLLHWIEELDGFEARIRAFCESISSQSSYVESPLQERIADLECISWMDSDGEAPSFSSSLYRKLLEFSVALKSMDTRIEAARGAQEALGSMSSPDSARTALERSRDLLIDATGGSDDAGDRIIKSSEKAHQLLNYVEDALIECVTFLDDDRGLLEQLKMERDSCAKSSDDFNEIIFEWNTLARKHGVSSYSLPSCHNCLRNQLDGNIEAKRRLPLAIERENDALERLQRAAFELTEAREALTRRISRSISDRLPMLGMENSRFEARLRPIDNPTFSASTLGMEDVDFYLLHDNHNANSDNNDNGEDDFESSQSRGGKLESVASSGEKARILLAIECEIPGSVGALCGAGLHGINSIIDNKSSQQQRNHHPHQRQAPPPPPPPPVAVLYDEIDAHVGGRASVAVGEMLADQSKSCQVISITHSPSVAAIANKHVCIRKESSPTSSSTIASARVVTGSSRRKELARMAAGDMAAKEAEVFVDALIRDVSQRTKRKVAKSKDV